MEKKWNAPLSAAITDCEYTLPKPIQSWGVSPLLLFCRITPKKEGGKLDAIFCVYRFLVTRIARMTPTMMMAMIMPIAAYVTSVPVLSVSVVGCVDGAAGGSVAVK
jgi:hypothetical protein